MNRPGRLTGRLLQLPRSGSFHVPGRSKDFEEGRSSRVPPLRSEGAFPFDGLFVNELTVVATPKDPGCRNDRGNVP